MTVLEQAIEAIKQEADALNNLVLNPPSMLEAVLQVLIACKGRIIVTGIGKSAIIGQKIVATFNSTGTNALFLHAADALHGDMGIINEQDIIILLSKSGETDELKVLIPALKTMGNTIIAMTCNSDSYLARESHYHLFLPVSSEADPNNLAPTTSTTIMLVMGDALAIALLHNKGFSKDQFARFHPGGMLGKQLYTRVCDLCHKIDPPMVKIQTPLQEVILSMTKGRMGATVVVSDQNSILGIVTDGDLRRLLMREKYDLLSSMAGEIMTASPKNINENEMAVEAFAVMRKYSITQLPVVDDQNKYCGIVHLHDLIKEGFV